MTDNMVWDVKRPRERQSRAGPVALAALVCLVIVAVPVGLGLRNHPREAPVTVDAVAEVGAALESTTGPGSFRIAYRSWETPAPSASSSTAGTCVVVPLPASGARPEQPGPTRPVTAPCVPRYAPRTLSGTATVNLHPFAIVTYSDVSNFGPVTAWSDGTRLWEQGGANAGLAPGSATGPGISLPAFASLVEGTLGRRLGGVAMLNLASPTGQLNLAREAVSQASRIGTDTIDGVSVTVYEVSVDRSKSLSLPDMTAEQRRTAADAFDVLRQEGYVDTRIRLGIDPAGLIRRSTATVRFADGGVVTGDHKLSDFGCAGRILISSQAGMRVDPEPCTPPPANTPAPTTATTRS